MGGCPQGPWCLLSHRQPSEDVVAFKRTFFWVIRGTDMPSTWPRSDTLLRGTRGGEDSPVGIQALCKPLPVPRPRVGLVLSSRPKPQLLSTSSSPPEAVCFTICEHQEEMK